MILDHLKTQTTALHKETEQDNLARFILDHSITTTQYTALLKQNWYAYAKVDQLLNDNASALPDYLKPFADGGKSKALESDLAQLNFKPQSNLTSEVQEMTPAELLGMIYVTEGSMLGGLLIRKNLESCSQLDGHFKHHFFGKSAPEVMQRWQAFKEAVSEKDFSSGECDEAVAGANYAFRIFKESYSLV